MKKITITTAILLALSSLANATEVKKINFGGWSWTEPKTVVAGEAQAVKKLEDFTSDKIASTRESTELDENINIRLQAVKEAAASVGAQAGLANKLEQKMKLVQSRKEILDAFDFSKLALSVPINQGQPVTEPNLLKNGEYVMIMPPILLKGLDEDFLPNEDVVVLSDIVYKIYQKERLVPIDKKTKRPAFPSWRDYLTFSFKEVQIPHQSVLPKTKEEKELWDLWLKKGWAEGEKQAEEMFEKGWANLERDAIGMLEGRLAYVNGRMSRVQVGISNMGIVGGGDAMKINHRIVRITDKGKLVPNPENWVNLDQK